MDETKLLKRITVDPDIFGGKPLIRGRRLAVEHVLGMLAVGGFTRDYTQWLPLVGAGGYPGLPDLRPQGYRTRTDLTDRSNANLLWPSIGL